MPKKGKAGKKDAKGKKGKKGAKGKVEPPVAVNPPAPVKPIEPKPDKNAPLGKPMGMISVFTLCGEYKTILKLLKTAFKAVDRVCLDTPWGTYVIFEMDLLKQKVYCVFDGCVCNPMRFRYFNLEGDKSDLVYFRSMHEMLKWIIMAHRHHGHCSFPGKINTEDVCYNENMKTIFL